MSDDDIDLAEAARIALACLDLTSLGSTDTAAQIEALCAKAHGPCGNVAAVCVWPRFVRQARGLLPAGIRVAAVANFPDGSIDTARALRDADAIIDAGGDEIDLVLPYRAFIDGRTRECTALVTAVRRLGAGQTLKLIIESGELRSDTLIAAACAVGLDAGVDFLKTSTGKSPVSATPQAAAVMLKAIAAHPRGGEVGFKASGGVRRVAEAAVYIELAREHLGAQSLVPSRLRFGASALLADIEATLGGPAAMVPPATGY
jgi:deoxyribose-phosphate aldolase